LDAAAVAVVFTAFLAATYLAFYSFLSATRALSREPGPRS
jgi:hypothetical protein